MSAPPGEPPGGTATARSVVPFAGGSVVATAGATPEGEVRAGMTEVTRAGRRWAWSGAVAAVCRRVGGRGVCLDVSHPRPRPPPPRRNCSRSRRPAVVSALIARSTPRRSAAVVSSAFARLVVVVARRAQPCSACGRARDAGPKRRPGTGVSGASRAAQAVGRSRAGATGCGRSQGKETRVQLAAGTSSGPHLRVGRVPC
jgi:hypothetical protein